MDRTSLRTPGGQPAKGDGWAATERMMMTEWRANSVPTRASTPCSRCEHPAGRHVNEGATKGCKSCATTSTSAPPVARATQSEPGASARITDTGVTGVADCVKGDRTSVLIGGRSHGDRTRACRGGLRRASSVQKLLFLLAAPLWVGGRRASVWPRQPSSSLALFVVADRGDAWSVITGTAVRSMLCCAMTPRDVPSRRSRDAL